jgi:mannose/fructose-specific phosphotransferase system component IIA
MADARRLAELSMPTELARETATQIDAAVAAKAQIAALVALTDSSGGTPGNTIADVPGSYTEATLANQLASLTAKINAIIAALKA